MGAVVRMASGLGSGRESRNRNVVQAPRFFSFSRRHEFDARSCRRTRRNWLDLAALVAEESSASFVPARAAYSHSAKSAGGSRCQPRRTTTSVP